MPNPIMRRHWLLAVVSVIAVGWWSLPLMVCHAQQINNPTAPPPGGQTAVPLNTSDQVQQKLGSLIIGQSPITKCNFTSGQTDGCSELCLNGSCLKSWSGLGAAVGNSFVGLRSFVPDAADRFNPAKYDASQTGYVKIKGTSITKLNTVMLGVYSGPGEYGPYTALYADAVQAGNYAGSFAGKFGVEPTSGNTFLGRLCLNGTGAHDGTSAEVLAGHYCISQWSDIKGLATVDKLTLQPSDAPLTMETGNVGLSQGFGAGAIVLGDPNAVSSALTCGDGMCGTNESSSICPIDCAAIMPVSTLVLAKAGTEISVSVTVPAQAFTGNVNLLVVRSDNPANNPFSPIDGIKYTAGGNSSFAVVYAGTVLSGGRTVTFADTGLGLVDGRTYTYSAYLANLFPRYSQPKTAAIETDFSSALLTLVVEPTEAATIVAVDDGGGGDSQSCGMGTNFCTISYPLGTNVAVGVDIFSRQYKFLFLEVTQSGITRPIYNESYYFPITTNTTVAARFVRVPAR